MSPEEEEEPEITCPVCGNVVTLDDEFCPHCGAEFEEEEIEEIIEVDEGAPEEEAPEFEYEEEYVEEYVEGPVEEACDVPYEEAEAPAKPAKPAKAAAAPSTGLWDMRVFGIALLLVGIIGAQIALMIDWYWSWVPPIGDNLGLFALLGIVVIIVGFLGFAWMKKALSEGKEVSSKLPMVMLAIFVFGIIVLIMLLLGVPISGAIGSSKIGMTGVFILLLVVGIFLYLMGQKRATPA